MIGGSKTVTDNFLLDQICGQSCRFCSGQAVLRLPNHKIYGHYLSISYLQMTSPTFSKSQ